MQILVASIVFLFSIQVHASLKGAEIILADLHSGEQKAVSAQDYDRLIELLVREVQIIEDEQLTKKEIQGLYKFGHPVLNQITEPAAVDGIVKTIRMKAEANPAVQAKMAELNHALKKGREELKYKTNAYTETVESVPSLVTLYFLQIPVYLLAFTNDPTIFGVGFSIWIGIPLTAKLGHVTDYLIALARRPKNGTQKILAALITKHQTELYANCERQLTRDNVRK